jgi:FixJ family two-component response regulator
LEARLNVKCISFGSLNDLLNSSSQVLATKTAILDIDLGPRQPTGLDAYHWLKEHHYQGDVHFLTGHGHQHPLVRFAEKEGCRIWQKPLVSKDLIAALRPTFFASELTRPSSLSEL